MLDRLLQIVASRVDRPIAEAIRADRVICIDDTQFPRRGALCLVFLNDEREPGLVIKAGPLAALRRRGAKSLYEIEIDNLERLRERAINRDLPAAPEPIGFWEEGGWAVAAQTGLPGSLMKNVSGRALFRGVARERTFDRVLSWWGHFQRSFGVERRRIDEPLYNQIVRAPLTEFLRHFRTDPDERESLNRRFGVERGLMGLELPFMVRHGDFCPANVVLHGDSIALFDWEFPIEPQFPLFDLFHFFSACRYPHRGLRGESSHFESFREVYWGDGDFGRSVGARLSAVCADYGVPRQALGDLFLLSLVEIANLKYDGLMEIRETIPADTGAAPVTWESAGGTDKNAPFFCVTGSVVQTVRQVVRRGLPPMFGS